MIKKRRFRKIVFIFITFFILPLGGRMISLLTDGDAELAFHAAENLCRRLVCFFDSQGVVTTSERYGERNALFALTKLFATIYVMIREVPGTAYFLYPHVPEDQSDTTKCAKNKYPCCQSNRR